MAQLGTNLGWCNSRTFALFIPFKEALFHSKRHPLKYCYVKWVWGHYFTQQLYEYKLHVRRGLNVGSFGINHQQNSRQRTVVRVKMVRNLHEQDEEEAGQGGGMDCRSEDKQRSS